MGGARVALAHEWLGGRTGSEKTFEVMASAFPAADLYALNWDREVPFDFGGRPVRTTFLDRPSPIRGRRALQLPLMPLAWRFAGRGQGAGPYDVVVTSSHACVKGFWPGRRALHLSYCYTPIRYVWLSSVDRRGAAARVPAAVLRAWDKRAVGWVDGFATISKVVQERVRRWYGRESIVIYPPVDTGFYAPGDAVAGGAPFALAVGRMVQYKRFDLAIDACHRLRVPLVIAGWGPQEPAIRAYAAAAGADVRFVILPSDEELRDLYRAASVVVFPAVEDFGIVPVEAAACGTPVVAVAEGGSAETVVPGVSGVLVAAQEVGLLARGVEEVLASPPPPDECRRHAERFSTGRFVREFTGWVASEAARRGIEVGVPVG